MVALPYTITNGATIDGSQLQANLTTLRDAMDLLTNSNIRTGAGIDQAKLAQRFINPDEWFTLLPVTSGADLNAVAQFGLPTALTEFWQTHVRLRSGQQASLCEAEWYVRSFHQGATNLEYPTMSLYVDGTQIGGQAHTVNATGYYYFGFATPVDNPLITLNDQSILSWRFGKTGASGGDAATISGVLARVTIKKDLVPG